MNGEMYTVMEKCLYDQITISAYAYLVIVWKNKHNYGNRILKNINKLKHIDKLTPVKVSVFFYLL